ncbi:MAG TPA: cytochrome c oxidase subunit II [Stellaceae bacterium]
MRRVGRVAAKGRALWSALTAMALAVALAPAALAEQPSEWQLGMQRGATPVRAEIDFLHNDILLPIITGITIFVLALLLYVIVRFNAKRHPTPSQTTHNTVIELIWTVVPVLILLIIAIPSFKLLYFVDRTQHADMTLKVTGHQWYWSYEYPDQGNVSFDSNMIPEEDQVKQKMLRLLEVDNPVVVPVDTTIRILVTGQDVIHSWYLPAAGVQEYAVIGRNNESWMRFERSDTYYGQCNQICGVNHPFMPIEVKAVSKENFGKWTECAKKPPKDDLSQCARFAVTDGDGEKSARLAEQSPE